jgi:hypothetical protein
MGAISFIESRRSPAAIIDRISRSPARARGRRSGAQEIWEGDLADAKHDNRGMRSRAAAWNQQRVPFSQPNTLGNGVAGVNAIFSDTLGRTYRLGMRMTF